MASLEFFCGIGGFNYALREARPSARVACAFDVDDVATRVYAFNFGAAARVSAIDVCQLDAAELNKLGAGLWMMSPPCQPYTRQGNALGAKDARAGGLAHLTRLLASPALSPPERLLMENVVGFETSESRDDLVCALRGRGFAVRELWLSPVHVGVPNQRTRYFLLAKRLPPGSCAPAAATAAPAAELDEAPRERARWPPHALLDAHELPPWDRGPGRPLPPLARGCARAERPLRDFLEEEEEAPGPGVDGASRGGDRVGADGASAPQGAGAGAVPAEIVAKYGAVLNVVCPASAHSCCFTKNYTRFAKGTGSVLAPDVEREDALQSAAFDAPARAALRLRYFTTREIANLHGFPRGGAFSFPADVPVRKRYSLLGNSLSVDVVAELLRYLYADADDAG